jgi:hypothetical protein
MASLHLEETKWWKERRKRSMVDLFLALVVRVGNRCREHR